jgi:membrane protein YqaA with SNARE-associated domain
VSGLTNWLLHAFLSPFGLLVLGALDSSIFVTAPFALDAALVVLVARHREQAWLFPLLATAGSVAGAAVTFWLGQKIGESGLQRHIPRHRLERTLARVRDTGTVALALLDLIPPPFPFTPVILVAGALELSFSRFLIALTIVKCARFGVEAALALIYGPQILLWLQSEWAMRIGALFVIVIVALTAYSAIKLVRARPYPRRSRAAAKQ